MNNIKNGFSTASFSSILPLYVVTGLVALGLGIYAPPAQAVCGDGIPDFDEVCDDGNLINGDGCNSICQLESNSCIDDVTGRTNVCTANDVRIALILNQTDAACELGTTIELDLIAELEATSSERWDIGMFIALDGGDARTGLCHQQALPPPLDVAGSYEPGSLTLNPDGSINTFIPGGPFYDGEDAEDPADMCGDLEQGVFTYYQFPYSLTVPCEDNDGDGAVDIGSCLSWDNARSDGGNKPSCLSIGDTEPNTKSKCKCETINIGNVFVAGKIVVDKVTAPAGDSQSFEFFLDAPDNVDDESFSLTDAQTPFEKALRPSDIAGGTYSVSETVPAGWELTDVTCTSDNGTPGDTGDDFTVADETAIDLGSGETVTCTFTNVKAAIGLAKVCDALSKVGDDVDYTITLDNNTAVGASALVCNITDTLLGIDKDVTLASGGSDVTNSSRTVQEGDTDPLVNTVNASCYFSGDATQTEVASGSANCSTDLFQPSITFDKTGDASSKIGDPTDYTITLTNTSSSDTPDLTCTVTDAAVGVNEQVTLAAGDPAHVINTSAAIPANATDPYVNTASVSCTVAGFPNVLNASDDHSVQLFQPSITFDKTGDASSKIGDPTDYTITLTNTSSSDTPDLTCTVTDAAVGVNEQVTLAAGDPAHVINTSAAIPANATDPYVNTASVSCTVAGFPNVLNASDDHSVQLFQPSITFDKTGDASSKIGDPTDYTITLTNTSSSDTPDLTCTVTDAAVGVNEQVTLAAGDPAHVINTSAAIPANATDPYVNTASVSCTVAGFPNVLNASDDHSVQLFQPSITFDKTGDASSKIGDPTDYTITLTNTSSSDTPDLTCTVTDAAVGVNEQVTLAAGDPAHVINTSAAIPANATDPYVNTASVSCTVAGFPNVLNASDDHSVQLFQPSITFDKTGDASSKIGDPTDYTITLTNTSSSDTPDLTCTVTDAAVGVNEQVTLAAGDPAHVINTSAAIPANATDPYVNTASVSCTVAGFPNVLNASDDHSVQLFQPSITFDKTGDASSKIGDPTDYTITLTNTSSSDTPDLTCTVTDAAVGVNEQVTLAAGDPAHVINTSAAIPANATDPYVNTASVSCTVAGFPNVLNASDDHSVQLFQPSITFDKTGDASSKIGDPTDYTITLTNTSSSDTPDLTCTVTDAAVGVNEQVTLAAGDPAHVINTSAAIPANATDPYVNTASVSCTVAGFPNVLNASDDHSVQLFQPSITFDKTGDASSKIGDPTDYTITLTNTSSSDTPDLTCTVTDAAVGVNEQVTLAAGDPAHVINTSAAIPANATDPYVNTASVSCTVAGFPNVLNASDDHSVQLFQPSITFDKTGDASSKIGDPTDYTITLTNTSSSDTPDLTCTVTDAAVGVNEQVTLAAGDPAHVINTSAAIPANATDPYVNTASVSCTVAGFPNVLNASDDHSVQLFQPSITFDKTGDASSKIGDPTDYTITLTNTSSSDTPDLTCTVTDAAVGVNEQVTLAAGDPAHVINTSAAIPANATDPYVNTASVSCTVAGFPNVLNASDDHSVDLINPSFTVAKVCTNEPVPQDGPATWDVIINNTGDVELVVTADDGIGTFNLAAGVSQTFPVSIAGPFAGQTSVSNTVNASWTLPAQFGPFLANTDSTSASDTCVVASEAKIIKLTQGLPNDSTNPAVQDWNFTLQDCGTDGCQQSDPVIAQVTSPPSMVSFDADLIPVQLDPNQTYRLCEVLVPTGWTIDFMGDADDDGTPETAISFIPAVDDDLVSNPPGWSRTFDPMYAPPPAIWSNEERCLNFVADAGATEVFQINNQFPGGRPSTIGFWKNWNSCSGGGQVDNAVENGGLTPAERLASGNALLDDVLQAPGITIGLLTLVADTDVYDCDDGTQQAVNLLDKRDIAPPNKKKANDAAYGLAAQLLAALANEAAGAGVCPEAGQAIIDGQQLLVDINFNGTGDYFTTKGKNAVDEINGRTKQEANDLAGTLDEYNNGTLCP